MLFGHSDDFYNYSQEVKINFSSNVWKGVNLDKLHLHLQESFKRISRYPEPDASSLKRLLARRFELKDEQVVAVGGSTAAFYLLAQAWRGGKSTILTPSFGEYESACLMHDHELTFFPSADGLANLSLKGQDFCWIGNPNSPDGRLFSRTEMLKLISANKHTTFVVDQAYAAFTTEDQLKPSDLKAHRNLVLVRSLSKAYNIPGLRVGYIAASTGATKEINKYLIPWSVNVLGIEASKYILIHPAQFTLPIRKWQRDTGDLIFQLNKLDGLEVQPTSTTFFLVRLKKGTAPALKDYLMKSHGILIRDASNFRGLDESCFRICSQSNDSNLLLVNAIRDWLESFE
ncbi:MAG: histidinol-phosphate aminotransferase family protein [Tannerellaceae bacterium]|jgi:threonine-phosphate decarboxylase|nr:histidinol-phosphate aminotransferase family protein [Tannerellaceae bacterium]